jgi:hypothetical protein
MAFREDGGSADRHETLAGEIFRDSVLRHQLRTIQFHRRQEMPVGQLRQALVFPGNADEILYVVVPGSDVLITNRPVHSDTLTQVGLKVEITPAVGLTSPNN